jgi:hypothetical protein
MRHFVTLLLVIGLLVSAAPVSAQQSTDNFFIMVGIIGTVWSSGGSGFNCGQWYTYPSGWVNEWFYDHPFDPQRGKIIHVSFDWAPYVCDFPVDMTVAVNWSTGAWSGLGYGTTLPPVPGNDEGLYIVRQPILHEVGYFQQQWNHFSTEFVISDYNPEWVSIDVMGANFNITGGVLVHECVVGTEGKTWGSIKTLFR